MRAHLLSLLRRQTRPPWALGILVAAVCLTVETLVAALLKQVTPVHSLDVVYLVGILLITFVWGLGLGMAMAVASTLTLDFFLFPPQWTLTPAKGEDWAALAIFIAIALLALSISRLTRSLAAEADARGEADLAAELARLLLRAPNLSMALPTAAHHLARTLELPYAAIELETIADDERHAAFPLRAGAFPLGTLLVPADLPRPTLRRLRERVVPALEVLLQAARERASVEDALKTNRDKLRRIADEQAALRRLATLVAHGAPSTEVFDAVAREVGQILGARHATVIHFEADNMMTVAGSWHQSVPEAAMAVGSRWPIDPGTVSEIVSRTGAPGRIDAFEGEGVLIKSLQRLEISPSVGCPIMIGRRLWGAVIASSTTPEPLPEGTERRIMDFTELVAAAIANAESRAELKASRARVVAAADETRRRIERDLHTGTQQRLVSLGLELRRLEAVVSPGSEEVEEGFAHMARLLDGAIEDLQEISRGLHPAILSKGGLERALTALARRSNVAVDLNVRADRRLAEHLEGTAYYIVSEALTNAVKHAHASMIQVDIVIEDMTIGLSVRDDGIGGADPGRGTGLTSLRDRVEALGGNIEIMSPVGAGTSVLAEIPIDGD